MNNIDTALIVSAIGMVGIFVFMTIFYLIIMLLDKFFPYEEEKENAPSA